MKRKTSSAPVRIYTYGLPMGPTDHAELVREQMRAAHRYHNDLIQVERARRAAVRMEIAAVANIGEIDQEIEQLTDELADMRQRIQSRRKETRARVRQREAEDRARELRAAIRAARATRKAAQSALRGDVALQARIAAINTRAHVLAKALRAHCGVYWGTYLLVEAAVDAQRRGKMDPRFRRWDGHGRVGVQIQGGMPALALVGGADTRLQIDRVDPRAWGGARAERRRLGRTTLRIRVGSDGRAPIWAAFPLVMHRPLPADGIIKSAWVQVRRIGTRERWELQVAVEALSLAAPERTGQRVAALNFGWRSRPHGIRVAYLVDSDGRKEEILVPDEIRAKLDHADSIRSIRDREFDAMKAYLRESFSELEAPQWLADELRHLAQWRAQARLVRVVQRWGTERFVGDGEIFASLERWRRQDRHLYQWEASERERALGRRRDLYRTIAARLARAYDEIMVPDTDLRALARRAAPEETDAQHPAARGARHVVAPGELRLAIRQAAAKRGTRVVETPSAWTTMTCSECGCECRWDAAEHIHHTCESCGAAWDQDANAARNMLISRTPGAVSDAAE